MTLLDPPPLLRQLQSLAPGGITSLSATIVLLALSVATRDGLRMKDLCHHTGTTPSNMTGIIDHLAAGGYVERHFQPHDRRGHAARITPAGLALLQRASLLP